MKHVTISTYRGVRNFPFWRRGAGGEVKPIARLAAIAAAAAALAGCGASGGGTSVGTYTGSGTTTMELSGQVLNSNNVPLAGYAVSIDGSTPCVCDRSGNYTISIPTIQIQTANTIDVFNTANTLAHVEQRPIDTAICIQTLKPIIVGPPTPPPLP